MATTLNNFLIPLQNISQQFGINLAGVNYILTCKWNNSDDAGWVLDIYDDNANPLAMNLPLITGGNILSGLDYLGFGGAMVIFTKGDYPDAVPTVDNLGTDSNLYFQTETVA